VKKSQRADQEESKRMIGKSRNIRGMGKDIERECRIRVGVWGV
jgi:hypothetical protein